MLPNFCTLRISECWCASSFSKADFQLDANQDRSVMKAVGNKAKPLKKWYCWGVVYILESQIQVLQELLASSSKIHSNNILWKFLGMGQDKAGQEEIPLTHNHWKLCTSAGQETTQDELSTGLLNSPHCQVTAQRKETFSSIPSCSPPFTLILGTQNQICLAEPKTSYRII